MKKTSDWIESSIWAAGFKGHCEICEDTEATCAVFQFERAGDEDNETVEVYLCASCLRMGLEALEP